MTTPAETARDQAIALTGTANADFVAAIVAWIRDVDVGYAFTTDDLWSRFVHPPEPRAMGAAIVAARRAGLIRAAGYVKSTRKECHARPVARWERTRS